MLTVEKHLLQEKINRMSRRKLRHRLLSCLWALDLQMWFLERETDGSVRSCFNYRQLNDFFAYPLPRMDNVLDRLGKAQIFEDIEQASHLASIRGREKRPSFLPMGFASSSMTFGFSKAPLTFDRSISTWTMSPLTWIVSFALKTLTRTEQYHAKIEYELLVKEFGCKRLYKYTGRR